jgi:hypothetical protein
MSTVFAQTATLRGKVTDAQSGEALPQANVQVTTTEIRTGTVLNIDGQYEVPKLAPASIRSRFRTSAMKARWLPTST